MDEGNAGTDHTPLTIECCLWSAVQKQKRTRPNFDRRELQKSDTRWLARQFSQPPSVPWQTNVDRHATILSEWISERLQVLFPSHGARPRKSYVTDGTWQLRGERLRLKHELTRARRQIGLLSLRQAFAGWASGQPFRNATIFTEALLGCRLLVNRKEQLAAHTKFLSRCLRRDRTTALEEVARKAKTMSPKEFADALRSMGVRSKKKPTGIIPLPMVYDEQGQPIDTCGALAERWRAHFATQEDGHVVEPQDLLLQQGRAMCEREKPQIDDVPTWREVEAAFRKTSRNRAYFADGVPGDLLAMIPEGMTEVFMPLFLKEVLYQREAVLYKGGNLVPAFKRGSPFLCENYRSLFVSSPVGKALHSLYRGRLGENFAESRRSMQLGQTQHAIRWPQGARHHAGLPCYPFVPWMVQ